MKSIYLFMLIFAILGNTLVSIWLAFVFVTSSGYPQSVGPILPVFLLWFEVMMLFSLILILRDIQKEKKLNRMKGEFVSLASHQLRTPLTVINWRSEILLNKKNGNLNEKQISSIEDIRLASRKMVEIINSLLNRFRKTS